MRAGRLSARSCCAPMQTRPCQFGKKAPALRERTKNQSVLYVRDPLFLCPVPMYNVHTRLFVCMCGMRYRHLIMHPLPRRNNDDDVRTMCENKTFFRLPCHYFTRNAERQRAAAIFVVTHGGMCSGGKRVKSNAWNLQKKRRWTR